MSRKIDKQEKCSRDRYFVKKNGEEGCMATLYES